nr:zinc finger, CCHC-type [Tanacetum cinerariifolium]
QKNDRSLEDFQLTVDAERSELAEAALRALKHEKQMLCHQQHRIETELALCDKKIHEIMNGDNKKDKTAMAFLYQALPEEQLLQITKHKTTKAIWDALKTRHIGEERVQQARLQTLKSDFEMLHMKEDETIDTFTTKLTTLVNKAASLGHTMKDRELVHKLLNAVPDRYLQIVASIEQYSDLDEMALEEAIGRLKTYEEMIKYKKGKQVDNQEKLMFTRHENKGRYSRGRGRGRYKFSQGRNARILRKRGKMEKPLIKIIIALRNQTLILAN